MADRARRVRWLGPGVALVLLAGGLSGCSSQTDSYCSDLKGDQAQLKKLSADSARSGARGATALDGTVRLLGSLRDSAPEDVSGDWDTLVQALRGLAEAIHASGAAPSDFGSGKKPRGVTEGQLQAVSQAAAELQATAVQQASKSIEQHAQDVCKVDLGSGLGGAG